MTEPTPPVFQPAAPIESLLAAVALNPAAAEGMRTMMDRRSEFPSLLQAQLTGVALDPYGRQVAEQALDTYWSDESRTQTLLRSDTAGREVVVGSGFHAAVYAAIRVLTGHRKPLVLERGRRVGGIFAMSAQPTFQLNTRNRPGTAGLAGDQRASLNYLPGALIQAANVSMSEFQTNADMAFVIRLALAQYADVVTNAEVQSVGGDDSAVNVDLGDRGTLPAGRLIDARGLGDPADQTVADGTTVLTFGQFMHRMATRWPLRGVRCAAVIGGGDAARCAVESFLGIAPQPSMAAAALDYVERIDWYSDELPTTCDSWRQQVRGRYQAIGQYLRPDRFGVRRLNVMARRARPVALPDTALIDGRTYDLVIVCTGSRETTIGGLDFTSFDEYSTADGTVVARQHLGLPAFRVGPHARLPFTRQEQQDGIADIAANAVSMFRTAVKTAVLAATLPPVTQP